MKHVRGAYACLFGLIVLGACGSSSNPATSYTVGGTTSGLNGTVVLQNNSADDLTIEEDGAFTFETALVDGASYEVTVLTQPDTETCSATNASGTISGADVTNVEVACSVNTYTIGGTISNMLGTIVLQNNGGDDLSITTEDGTFTFTTAVADGSSYAVTILTQPASQTCALSNEAGTVAHANVADVAVSCPLIIYGTGATGVSAGNLGGISGADDLCMTSSSYPGVGTFKAMIVDGTNRIACITAECSGGISENKDWVLAADTTYYVKGALAVIGMTNSGGAFTFPLENPISVNDAHAWTGLSTDWTTNANTCTGWTSSGADVSGRRGRQNQTSTDAISRNSATCDNPQRLICVQQ